MKKFNFLFIVIALLFASCSDDDSVNDPGDISGDLLGTWIGVDVDYTGDSTTEVQGQQFVADFVGEAYDVDYTLTFTENPNEVVANGSYSIELTTTTMGISQVDNVENLEFLNDGSWLRTGNQLSVTTDGETTVATILELTATSLILGSSQTEEINEQGISVTSNIDVIMTYSKL